MITVTAGVVGLGIVGLGIWTWPGGHGLWTCAVTGGAVHGFPAWFGGHGFLWWLTEPCWPTVTTTPWWVDWWVEPWWVEPW